MKNIAFLTILILSFIGCAKPYHYHGTQELNSKDLSIMSFNDNEVMILAIDDVRFDGYKRFNFLQAKGMPFFIKSGKHKITAMLTWNSMIFIGNVGVSSTYKSPYIKTVCVDMKPGKEYYFYAREPGENWKFLVADSTDFALVEFPIIKPISCDELKVQ